MSPDPFPLIPMIHIIELSLNIDNNACFLKIFGIRTPEAKYSQQK